MNTVDGRLVAALILTLAGAGLITLAVVGLAANRLTPHEVLAGVIALVVAAVAGLWLRVHGGWKR